MPTALVVEDDPDVADLVAVLFGRLGFEPVPARTYVDAELLVQASTLVFDIAYVDAVLPDGLGRNLIYVLRTRRFGLPCILASGSPRSAAQPDPDDVVRLAKPFTIEEFDAAVREAMR
jgi:DNA-binding response OmpR family regulator